jgi:transcriptional regulator GlxA family with amidase domain
MVSTLEEASAPNRAAGQDRDPGVQPDLKVAFILSPEFTLLPFAGFVEALRHAADEADRSRQIYCRWSLLAPELAPLRASCGAEIMPQQRLGDPADFHYIVVVGGLLPQCRDLPEPTLDFLRLAAARGIPLIGLCTGCFILADAGLMRGRRCAVHWRHRQDLITRFPDIIAVSDETYVIDEGIITCPGGTAAIDLATELIIRHCGRARALKGLHDMVVEPHRAAHHVPRRPYEDIASCGDPRVERAVALMEQNLAGPFGVETLSGQLGTTAARPRLRQARRGRAGGALAGNAAEPCALAAAQHLAHGHAGRLRVRVLRRLALRPLVQAGLRREPLSVPPAAPPSGDPVTAESFGAGNGSTGQADAGARRRSNHGCAAEAPPGFGCKGTRAVGQWGSAAKGQEPSVNVVHTRSACGSQSGRSPNAPHTAGFDPEETLAKATLKSSGSL